MSADAPSHETSPTFPLQDVAGDTERAAHIDHDPAHEAAHAWEHFRDNARWFLLAFLPIIALTVIGFVVDFGSTPMAFNLAGHVFHITGNTIAALVLAFWRCALIAWFLEHLFKDYSFIFRTLAFSLLFLGGMIFLSLWDSEVKPGKVGDPIYDWQHPDTMKVEQ
jgi:hypothetical protein